MLAFLGAALAPPVLALFVMYLLLLAGLSLAVFLQSTPLGIVWGAAAVCCAVFLGFLFVRSLLRRFFARKSVLALHPSLDNSLAKQAGPKGANLLRLAALSETIPRGYFLPFHTLERIRSEGPSSPTLRRVSRKLLKSFRKLRVHSLIVRSSFSMEDGPRLFPGVFDSRTDVSANDPAALGNAILEVLGSLDTEHARRYKERIQASEIPEGGAILIQEKIMHSVHATVSSCHPIGKRPDRIRIELDRPDGETRSVEISRLYWRAVDSTGGLEWLPESLALRAAKTVERAERAFKGPVLLEFGITENRLVFYQVRAQPVTPADVWTQSGPVSLNPEVLSPLESDLCYGKNLAFLRAHLCRSFGWDEHRTRLRLETKRGRPFVCLTDVLQASWTTPRRLFPHLGSRWLREDLPAGLDHAAEVIHLRKRLIKQAKLKSWSVWLTNAGTALAQLERRSGFDPLVGWHRLVGKKLETLGKCTMKRVDRLHEEFENELARITQRLGVNERNDAMFCSLEEICTKIAVDEEELLRRKESSSKNRNAGMSEVLPPWPTSEGGEFQSLCPGHATGRGYHPLSGDPFPTDAPCILLLPDASLRWREYLPQAAGVVLAGGAMLSHLALQIDELKLPALAASDAEELMRHHGQSLDLDTESRTLRRLS